MTEPSYKVHYLAEGEISVWLDGGIHIKTLNPSGDPVEMSERDARELAALLLQLAAADE